MAGLEVLGAIASVAQLAAVVISISKQLYEVAKALSNAPSDIEDLAHDLDTFHDELILYADLVNARNARYSEIFSRVTAKIIDRCADICVKIDKILKKLRSGSRWKKIKWIYKEKEIVNLLQKLLGLRMSLLCVLSVLNSLKTDHMLDALGVATPSVFASAENEGLSPETIAAIEETRRKLAGISVSGANVQDASEQTKPYNSFSSSGHAMTNNLSMRCTPSTLGWTLVENRLQQYEFVVTAAEEPYFELLDKAPNTTTNPTRVYLDKNPDPVQGVYPCRYPGGCKLEGKHSFFVLADLERHYRIAHGGVDKSRKIISHVSDQSVAPDKSVGSISTFNTTHQATSPETARNQMANSELNLESILNSASTSVDRSNTTASTIISPIPNRIMRHQLESTGSFHSAVTHQVSRDSLWEDGLDQGALQIVKRDIGGPQMEQPMSRIVLQDPAYGTWRHEMIESAVKHLKMTRSHAESWVWTLSEPITGMMSDEASGASVFPAKSTQTAHGSHANDLIQIPDASRSSLPQQPVDLFDGRTKGSQMMQSSSYAASTSTGVPRQYSLQSAASASGTSQRKERDRRHLGGLDRANEYFLLGDGIDREVITADICRYLGNDSLVRMGSYMDPQTRQVHEGYFITAYRNLTTAMIADLKADSARWEAEQRATVSKGQPTSTGYSDLHSHSIPDCYVTGSDLAVDPRSVSTRTVPAVDQRAYNIESNYFISDSSAWKPTSVADPKRAPPISRSSKLWWHAFLRLEQMDRRISGTLLGRWQAAGASTPLNDDPIGQAIAIRRADKLLIALAISDDLPNEDFGLNSEALNSVVVISKIIEVMKSTLKFKVGAFVWTLFCQALEAMVTQDQQNSRTRADYILRNTAGIATLIARYNVMENIYNEWPGLSVDQGLTDSLTQMCALVMLFIGQLAHYRHSHESSVEEDEALKALDETIARIRSADDECRSFTVRAFDAALPDVEDYIEEISDEEEGRGLLTLNSRTKRGRDGARNDKVDPNGYGFEATEADHIEAHTAKRTRFYS